MENVAQTIDFTNNPPLPPLSMQTGGPLGVGSQMSDTIASMRLENNPIIANLYRDLGDYEITFDERTNQVIASRGPNASPMLNDEGLKRIVAILRSHINPVTSLSNTDELKANILFKQDMYGFILDIVINKDTWAIKNSDRKTVISILRSLTYHQLSRSIEGHESRFINKQVFEQNVNQQLTSPSGQRQSGGIGGLFKSFYKGG